MAEEEENIRGKLERNQLYSQRLEEILGCGKFQYFQVFIFTAVVAFVAATSTFQFAFTIADGKHRCSLPPQVEKKYVRQTKSYLRVNQLKRKLHH